MQIDFMPPALDVDQIASRVDGQLASVTVLPSVESTNSYLLERPIEISQATVCLAEQQTAGRGRRGNDWQSAANRNIMMSLSWGFHGWPESITGLGLAVAIVITERLNKNFDLDVKIKWPNDLMVNDDKLAGILVDVSGQTGSACNVVIGLGLNVSQPDWSTREVRSVDVKASVKLKYRWQDLAGLGVKADRNKLAGDLINDLIAMLVQFEKTGFAPMVDRWNVLSSYQGRRISVGQGDFLIEGNMLGVTADGAIKVQMSGGVERLITDSNLSVRLL